ncbi:MAG: hypothetical protein CMJ18_07405 [Phycisphaeraceae bacterium]|nr:hypothetical protein [Phycisphaeraceae bacterium]
MERRPLGESGLDVSTVALGCFAMGGKKWGGDVRDEDSIDAIRLAIDRGVNLLDTAASYGAGHSERIVGRAVRGSREKVVLASKIMVGFQDEDEVRMSLEDSLRKLDVDCIDLYQVHVPNRADMDANLRVLEQMERFRGEGRIRAIGVSNFSTEQLDRGRQVARIDSVQPPYSLLWRHVEMELLPYCRRHGIAVLAYSPLGQGMLTGKYSGAVSFPEGDARRPNLLFHPDNLDDSLAVVDVVSRIARARSRTTAQVAVRWVLQQAGVTSALVGGKRPEQVEENLGGDGWALSEDELQQLNRISQQVHERRTTTVPENLMIWQDVPDPFDEPVRSRIREQYLESRAVT